MRDNLASEHQPHKQIFDYFVRKKTVDTDWVKRQVYGLDPEVFPVKLVDFGDLMNKMKTKRAQVQ